MEGIIPFADWEKVALKVGEITEVAEISGADKLYKLSIDLGSEMRTICAGIKQFYARDELIGKRVVVVSNLAPRMMRGIMSEGMLLAAVSDDEKTVSLLSPDAEVPVGSKVR